jgi:hypothetical protein
VFLGELGKLIKIIFPLEDSSYELRLNQLQVHPEARGIRSIEKSSKFIEN